MLQKWKTFWPFLFFAILIASRDIFFELHFQEYVSPIFFSFLITSMIVVVSFVILLLKGKFLGLIQKVKKVEIWTRAIFLGMMASLIYFVTFFVIKKTGAGLFNLIDYGFAPILTVFLGFIFFKEKTSSNLFISFIFYVLGLIILYFNFGDSGSGKAIKNFIFIVFAFLSPVGTAVSDYLTKWLLDSDRGNLDKEELLFIRFLPASIILFFIFFNFDTTNISEIHYTAWVNLASASIILGFWPLYLLCIGLTSSSLSKYAVWEFLIPAIAFFVPYIINEGITYHPQLWGALLIILGIIISNIDFNVKSNHS